MDPIQWLWLGPGDSPKGVANVRKDEYRLKFTPDVLKLKTVSEQTTSVSLVIPIPTKCKDDLAGVFAKFALNLNGERDEHYMMLAPKKTTFPFQIPDQKSGEHIKGKLVLKDISNNNKLKNILLKAPDPIELEFYAPQKLTLSIEPKLDVYAKVGENVNFSAKASDGASVVWSIDGTDYKSNTASHKFVRSGDYWAIAKAVPKKDDFSGTCASNKVHVIDAGVEINVSSNPTVGEQVVFKAQTKGHPEDISWWIDGKSFEKESKELPYVFDRSGEHTVKARVSYGHAISEESSKTFDVAVQPNLSIIEPVDIEYEFGQEIECVANVEGNFDQVVWAITGPLTNASLVSEVKDKRVYAKFIPTKSGEYTLTASAKKSERSVKDEAKFRVALETPIRIVSPTSGSFIKLGAGANNNDLVAKVTDKAIKQVKWTMLNSKTGEKKDILDDPVPVQDDGYVKCACPSDTAIGNNVKLLIQAEAVFDPPRSGESIFSPKIQLTTWIDNKFDIIVEPESRESDGSVFFGTPVAFKAICGGCVDPKTVQWFVEGKSDPIRKADENQPYILEKPKGKSSHTAYYYAKAELSDGSSITSDTVSIFYKCECHGLKTYISPLENNGSIIFGLKDIVKTKINIIPEWKNLNNVVWDWGDKVTTTNNSQIPADHKYKHYGNYTITAKGKCSLCEKEYSAIFEIIVSNKPVVVDFKICKSTSRDAAAGAWVSQGSTIEVVSNCKGDFDDNGFVWYLNDEELSEKKESFTYDCTKIGKHEFKLVVRDKSGNYSKPEIHSVRVYRLWLIVILILVALILCSIIWYYWSGDDPRFWILNVLLSARNTHNAKTANDNMPPAIISVSDYWNNWKKRALIKLSDIANDTGEWSSDTDNGKVELCLAESEAAQSPGNKCDKLPSANLQNKPDTMVLSYYDDGRLLQITVPLPSCQDSHLRTTPKTALWIKIVTKNEDANLNYLWYRIVMTIVVLSLVFMLIAVFAA